MSRVSLRDLGPVCDSRQTQSKIGSDTVGAMVSRLTPASTEVALKRVLLKSRALKNTNKLSHNTVGELVTNTPQAYLKFGLKYEWHCVSSWLSLPSSLCVTQSVLV